MALLRALGEASPAVTATNLSTLESENRVNKPTNKCSNIFTIIVYQNTITPSVTVSPITEPDRSSFTSTTNHDESIYDPTENGTILIEAIQNSTSP